MNDDLISREALKKSMRKSINERYISWTKTITVADIATLIFDEIEYAPTVEPYQGEECVNIKMTEEESKQFKQMLQEYTPLYTITSDTFVEGASAERPTGEWIPVSERLPDIAKKCILQLSDGYITMGTYHSIGKWIFIETSIAYVYGKETVIAWMPLPEPYKEVEKIEVEEPITLTDEQITEMWESGYISDKEEYKDGND